MWRTRRGREAWHRARLLKERSQSSRNTTGMDLGSRVAIGVVLSGIIAFGARQLEVLTVSGGWAALLVGTMLFVGGGWTWLVLVGTFSATSSFLTRWDPPGATAPRSADATGRHWDQVVANGGIAGLAAAIHGFSGWPHAFAVAAGAIAAGTADTWATEVGRWTSAQPRMVTTWRAVPAGTSGAITMVGTLGGVAGALTIGGLASVLIRDLPARAVFLTVLGAGISGMMIDSLLGATVEGRMRWVNNSMVNLMATAWGAGIVLAVFR